jgi:hypothetical protein
MPTPGPTSSNYQSLTEPFIDVKRDFHAQGDGATDDSVAINAAVTAAANNFGAGTVYFPPGTYLCKSTITMLGQVHLKGAGIEASVIKLASSVNADLISSGTASINLGASFGSGSTGGIYNWSMQDLTLDGNKAGQSSGTSYCIRIYGYGYILDRVRIRNGYTGGALFDWNGGNTSPGQDQAQAQFNDVIVHDNNGIGLELGGPHDSQFLNIVTFNNGSHGLHVAPNATACIFANVRSSAVPSGVSAVAILIEANNCLFISCVAQDSDTAQVVILANQVTWIGFAYGGSGNATTAGIQIGQAAGNTPYSGSLNQSGGNTTAVTPLSCYIEGVLLNNNGTNGQIWLANDGGNNNLRIASQQASGKVIAGTIATTSSIQASMSGLTADGTTGKGGIFRIAQLANQALLVSDKTNDIVNVNTNSKRAEFVNGTILRLYTDAYTTRSVEIGTNGTIATQQSATAVAITNNAQIATNVGVSRVAPGGAVTGITLQAGTIAGQEVWIVNESAAANSVTLNTTPATANVADSVTESALAGLKARKYVWDSATSFWYPAS